jgi:hypothetical protein
LRIDRVGDKTDASGETVSDGNGVEEGVSEPDQGLKNIIAAKTRMPTRQE